MRNTYSLKSIYILVLAILLPAVCGADDISLSRQQFIQSMLSNAQQANRMISYERARTNSLYHEFINKKVLSPRNVNWLTQLADYYGIKKFHLTNQSSWQELIRRVDIIPPSLIIAQAAYESAWGQSRFARTGYSYFGERCYTQGCGIIPLARSTQAKFEVKKFKKILDAIKSYAHNLNTHSAYSHLRNLREQQRIKHNILQGAVLAEGLEKYSQQERYYVYAIRKIIKNYGLWKYDVGEDDSA